MYWRSKEVIQIMSPAEVIWPGLFPEDIGRTISNNDDVGSMSLANFKLLTKPRNLRSEPFSK